MNNEDIYNKRVIAKTFNNFFINIGPNLADKIDEPFRHFSSYLEKPETIMPWDDLTDNEFQEALSSLKMNKSSGWDEISSNAIKPCSDLLTKPLKHIFKLSFKKGIVPNALKVAKVIPIFKSGEKDSVKNYRPISVLPCFSKILERIMYNKLYKHLQDNNILYPKQFGFQKFHSTDYAIVQLTDQILDAFEENKFTLGIFIDLSKAFDTVNHDILLEKLKLYGVQNCNLNWFKSYLSQRKQYISFDQEKTEMLHIKCGVPQGSIIGPLLFLLYVNDLPNASKILDPIMFADDTNLFYSHSDIKILFKTVNEELHKLSEWFSCNKLSLNTDKTKYTFFHKLRQSDNIPLKLPKLTINNIAIKRDYVTKFLGILIDENITWKPHIHYIENKISKNVGLLYKAKFSLNQKSLKSIYFSFIHSYLNYGNVAWASTHQTKLKKLLKFQKHSSRIIYNEDKTTHARPLMKSLNALNIYQINIFQNVLLTFKSRNNLAPKLFQEKFKTIKNKYKTRNNSQNVYLPKSINKSSDFKISFRGPLLWNKLLNEECKTSKCLYTVKSKLKKQLLDNDNELHYY